MKVDRLDAHDRFTFMKAQKHSQTIGECCQSLIDQKPFGDHPFYIFAHKREIGVDERFNLFVDWLTQGKAKTIEDVPTHRLIWQPRLTKPKAQTNSMLFKAYPGGDLIKVIWILPEREMWETYKKGNMTEHEVVIESIHEFETNRDAMEAREADDLSEEAVTRIYEQISKNAKYNRSKQEP